MNRLQSVLLVTANIFLAAILAILVFIVFGKFENQTAKQENDFDGQVASVSLDEEIDPSVPPTVKLGKIAYYVSPTGNDSRDGTSANSALKTIQRAVDLAQPGETIQLQPGTYMQDVITKRNGTEQAPIAITGTRDAIIKGAGQDRVVEINHDFVVLDGFTIDGQFGSSTSENGFRDKLIYMHGKGQKDGVEGIRLLNLDIKNAAGECVRMRYFNQRNEIAYNTIRNCGVADFKFNAGGKNGEGIYIGTAPEQTTDGKNPTPDSDASNDNWIHHNVFDTQGNECVDVKEGASGNIVEHNKCTGQKDPESGGMDSRGNGNIFRLNEIYGNLGAGVRLGGDEESDGLDNSVYKNTIRNNQNGGIKFQAGRQAVICGNVMSGNRTGNSVGDFGAGIDATKQCQ